MKLRYLIVVLFFSANFFFVSAQQTEAAARDVYKWKAYDNSASSVKKDAIDFRMFQGRWSANEGWHYGDTEKFWKDFNKPRIIEFRGNQYRSGSYGAYKTYKMIGNLLIFKSENKVDSACINMITESKLIISFKRGKDFEKYIFER